MDRARRMTRHVCPLAVGLAAALLVLAQGLAHAQQCGVPGLAGPVNISGVINSYWPGTATASAGATSITLGTRTGAADSIVAGDLVLVIQMQDAAINSTDTDAYGNGVGGDIVAPANPGATAASGSTNQNNAGRYEYVVATNTIGAGGGGLALGAGLANTYTNANATVTQGQRRFQVVRVPQYSSATITGTITGVAWNGTTGGIVAADVAGQLNFNGQTVSVAVQGFRGGRGLGGGNNNPGPATFEFRGDTGVANFDNSGFKGEGIAGTPTEVWNGTAVVTGLSGYPNGNRGLGAPGNAGGGGWLDAAGGGGANAGSGGRGGDEYCPDAQCGPVGDGSSSDHAAGATGGLGGLFTGASATRMVMGGGGGGGANHNDTNGHGGVGGGIVLIRAGTSTGTGTINAAGANGITDSSPGNGGGGGAGGSVFVSSGSSLAGMTINAAGAGGANATNHAPGGGGGGGAVYQSGGAAVSVTAGANGVRTTNAPLGANNATSGADGSSVLATDTDPEGTHGGGACLPQLTVTKVTSTPTRNLADTTASYSVVVTNAVGRGTAQGVNVVDDLPNPFQYSGAAVPAGLAGGATGVSPITGSGTDPVTFGIAGGTAANSWALPGGASVTLPFEVNLNSATTGIYQNPGTANFLDPTRTIAGQAVTPGGTYASGVAVAGSNYVAASTTSEDVTITPPLTVVKNSSVHSDPQNNTTNPKRIPGAFVHYSILVTNIDPVALSADSVAIVDAIPPNTDLYVGDIGGSPAGPVSYLDAPPPSGLTPLVFTSLASATDDVSFSDDGGVTFTYTPVPNGLGVDPAVTHIRINPKGSMSGNGADFTVTFRVRIE